MTWNLRTHIATNGLKRSIEGNFGIAVELTDPDGNDITTNEAGETLKAQVLYDFDSIDPESGNMIVVEETQVSIRKTALARVPAAGEKWGIRIPVDPSDPSTLTQYLINTDEAPVGGSSIGFITLNLKQVDQTLVAP